MKFIFDNKFAPQTDGIAFIKCDIDLALEKYLEWILPQINNRIDNQKLFPESDWNAYNERLPIVTEHKGTFIELIERLQPLYYPQKTLFFQCKNGWVGYLENINGTETRRITQISSRINENMNSIGVQAWQGGGRKIANGWSGGSFSLYSGKENYGLKRHIMLSDQDRWEFDQSGTPLPFEEIEKYNEKLVRNRFTPEMLQRYLLEFGIDFFNEDFYMPAGSKAYIIEYVRDKFDNEEPKTLKQRRIELNYETI